MAYKDPISTLLGKDQWSIVKEDVYFGVPNTMRLRGRPKNIMNFFLDNNKR